MLLTKKIRIFPSEKQKELLWILSEKCRLIYNFALKDRKNNFDFYLFVKDFNIFGSNHYIPTPYISYIDQIKKIPKLRNELYPEYQWILSRVLEMTLKKLDANYQSFFSNYKRWMKLPKNKKFIWIDGKKIPWEKPSPPRYKGKKYFMTLNFNRSGFSKNNYKQVKFNHKHPNYDKNLLTFNIPKKAHFIMKKCIEGKIKQIEIKKEVDKWYILVCNDIETHKYEDNGKYQAIDLGISDIVTAVNLDDKTLHMKNRLQEIEKYYNPKIDSLKSRRDHCKHPSREHPNFKKSRKYIYYDNKIKKMSRKRSNKIKYFQHFLSNIIVKNTRANTIIVGDLNIKPMSKKKKGSGNSKENKKNKTINRRNLSGSLGRFTEFLTYKAERIGKRVIKIDESYTSIVCCTCGSKKKMSLDKREYICDECENIMNRDENSARNIMTRFLETRKNYKFLSRKPSLQGNENILINYFIKKYPGISIYDANYG